MTEHSDPDAFEQRLSNLARAYTRPAAQPIDPLATARLAMHAPAGRMARLERAWWRTLDPRLVALLVAAAALIVLTALAIAGGALQRRDAGPLAAAGELVFARDGDLFTSAGDGTGVTRIREGGAGGTALGYLAALWSPDLRHIAAVRDTDGPVLTPVVEIMATDGSDVRTIELGQGGMPSLSWSPDGTRLAVASYPAEVKRGDAIAPVASAVRLQIVDLAGDTREIDLPAGTSGFAGANPELWTTPSLGLHWSPDDRWIATAWQSIEPSGTWHLVAPDRSTIQDLTTAPEPRCGLAGHLGWFPDGRRLTTVSDQSGTQELCAMDIAIDGTAGQGPEPTPIAELETDPTSNRTAKLVLPIVAPGGDRIAVSTFANDNTQGRYLTSLRVYELASGRWQDIASGAQMFDPNAANFGTTLDGTPVFEGGVAWTPNGQHLLFLSPEPGDGSKLWTLREVDAAGRRAPTVILEHIRSYDVAAAR